MHYTQYKTILSQHNGMNIYRGCSHGCIYCDSRSLCYQFNHDFEDIEVKTNTLIILENQLKSKRKLCMIATGAMCDPYIPLEEELRLTRGCLELIDKYNCGIAIQTKSNRILRDFDLIKRINDKTKAVVQMTLTTYDEELCKMLEPYVSSTKERFKVLKILHEEGIPTVVWLSPILPFINDTEKNLYGILNYCIEAHVKGIICFGFGTTMRDGSRDYFYKKLDESFPGMKEKYIEKYGYMYECLSPNNNNLMQIFTKECETYGIMHNNTEIFNYLRELELKPNQLSIF